MSIFTSSLRPSIQSSPLSNFEIYSISSSSVLSSLAVSASEIASFGSVLSHVENGGCIDWAAFEAWLKRRGLSRKHRVDVLNKAKRFWAVLLLGDFKLLRDAVNRRHVLAALSNLARFLGIYGKWRLMLMENGVSWSDGKNDAEWVFRRIYDGEIDDLDSWIEILKERANSWLWNYVVFLGLSGLRPNEAVTALNLIKEGKLGSYLNREFMTLEHFRFSKLFLRNTKKAYVTVLTDKMLLLLENWEKEGKRLTYDIVAGKIERLGLKVRLNQLRKNWATFLWKKGIPVELIDLCQGRCGVSVFSRHYFRPMFHEEAEKVRKAVKELEKKLIS